MVSTKAVLFSAALLASSVFAAPAIDGELQKRGCGEMINSPAGSFPMCWGPCASDPACTGGQHSGGQPAPQPQPQPAPPAPPAQDSKNQNNGGNSGSTDIDAINTYRALMKKPNLSVGSNLLPNIQKTLADHPGQMVHELNPGSGSLAQVLAQGNCNDFKTALVDGWICEIPSLLPAGSCNGNHYTSNGETGHAQILSSTSYTKVACACANGIWGCDFGA